MVYTQQIRIYVNVTAGWMDITDKVIGDISIEWGFSDNNVDNRIANPGFFTFTLNNTSKVFTPNYQDAIAGWKKGIPAYLEITYDGISYKRFYGRVDNIVINSSVDIDNTVDVTITDWLDVAQKTPVIATPVVLNYTTKQSIEALLATMPVQPAHTDLSTNVDTFATMFDDVQKYSSVYSEMNKIILSEFGFIYLRKDRVDGETLILEGRNDRNSHDVPAILPVDRASSSQIAIHGDTVLRLHGADSVLVLHEYTDSNYSDLMSDLGVKFGTNLANRISLTVFPKKTDTGLVVLSTLQQPIYIAAGETASNIKIFFRDPVAGTPITGTNIQTRVATTDYKMYANSDGTGTDLTANLTVTAVESAESTTYTLQNTGVTNGYVTFLQARGYGIYRYDPVEIVAFDQPSIDQYGFENLFISAKYQQTSAIGESITGIILDQNKDPRTILQSVTFLANTNHLLMISFLRGDIGDLVYIQNTQTGIGSYYYINNVKATITQDEIIHFTWGLREALTLNEFYWELETVGFSELEETTIIAPA